MNFGHVMGAAWSVGLVMSDRKPYPSNVTDEQWALIGPFPDAWRAGRASVAGRHGEQDLREVVNAILYQNRTGCEWAYLPHGLPQKPMPYYYVCAWRDDGTDTVVHDLQRCQTRERGRPAGEPVRGSDRHAVDQGGEPHPGRYYGEKMPVNGCLAGGGA